MSVGVIKSVSFKTSSEPASFSEFASISIADSIIFSPLTLSVALSICDEFASMSIINFDS